MIKGIIADAANIKKQILNELLTHTHVEYERDYTLRGTGYTTAIYELAEEYFVLTGVRATIVEGKHRPPSSRTFVRCVNEEPLIKYILGTETIVFIDNSVKYPRRALDTIRARGFHGKTVCMSEVGV